MSNRSARLTKLLLVKEREATLAHEVFGSTTLVDKRCTHKSDEQRVWCKRSPLEFRVELRTDEERMVG
jgi:hypothetical protein